VSLFDAFPFQVFLAITLAGIGVGFGLRLLVHAAGLRRDGLVESRDERFTNTVAMLTQSGAIGFALTFLAALLAAPRIGDPRLLAAATFGFALMTSLLAEFLRALIRRLFYSDGPGPR
jgi:uncharacterized membrane protein YczE